MKIKQEWIEVRINTNEIRLYRIKKRIYSKKSPFQFIQVVQLYTQGTTLLLDGQARVFESDEFIYHEALIHPAMHLHSDAKHVLIIGDGDGGGVREILKYFDIHEIDWVEVDQMVFEICRDFLPSCPNDLLSDKRLQPHWMEGVSFLNESRKRYDIIFISVTELTENNICESFYSESTANLLYKHLKLDGICVQSAGPAYPGCISNFSEVLKRFSAVFPYTDYYSVGLPSFGIDWAFCIGALDTPNNLPIQRRLSGLKLYDESTHLKMFTKSKWLKEMLDLAQ